MTVKIVQINRILFHVYNFHILDYWKLHTYMGSSVVVLVLLLVYILEVVKRLKENIREGRWGKVGVRSEVFVDDKTRDSDIYSKGLKINLSWYILVLSNRLKEFILNK